MRLWKIEGDQICCTPQQGFGEFTQITEEFVWQAEALAEASGKRIVGHKYFAKARAFFARMK